MNKYEGRIGEVMTTIEGPSVKEALEALGVATIAKSNNRYVGQLTDGRRFSFRTTPNTGWRKRVQTDS